jgi:hypothetical protein
MFCSKEDAQLLLEKWKTESASVVLFAELPASRFVLTGSIYDVVDNEIRFLCGTGNQVAIDMSEVRFSYGDPRERAQRASPLHSSTFHSFLHLTTENEDIAYGFFEATEDHLKNFLGPESRG